MKRWIPLIALAVGCGNCSDDPSNIDAGDVRLDRDASTPADDMGTSDQGGADLGSAPDMTARVDMADCDLELLHQPVTSHEIGTALDIVAQIDPAPAAATLHYRRLHETIVNEVAMTDAGGGSWIATLPPVVPTFSGIEYWVAATLGDCTVTSPSAMPEQSPHQVSVFGEYRVTQASGEYDYSPDVWERQVVFAQEQQGGLGDDILLFDIDALQVRKVTDDARAQGAPRIFGRNVVFVDNYGDNPEIALHDLETGTTHRVTDEPEGQYGLEIHDRIIVWRDDRNRGTTTDGDIFGYDLGEDLTFGTGDDRGELSLVTRARDQTAPKVHVDENGRVRVVYASMWDDADGVCDANCDWNIYLLDFGVDGIFGTGDDIGPTAVTTDPNEQTSPVIWGTRIVWLDARGGNWLDPDIWSLDLGPDGLLGTADDTPAEELDLPVNDPGDLAIWQSLLVWEDYRTGGFELYSWDFDAASENQLTDIAGGQFYPEVWSNAIVWQDARNNGNAEVFDDIYLYVRP